jgi:phenylacetate-CoA oxygenase PaaH subunit
MSDTQWRRYQVFVQSKPGEPHQDAGSVHAPDAEIALQYARDVFARRPLCSSMWVVPSDEIYSLTREELQEAELLQNDSDPASTDTQEYLVFCKLKQSGTHLHIERLIAANQKQALAKVIQATIPNSQPLSYWVIESKRIIKSDPSEVESLFVPATRKTFRDSAEFHTLSAMRALEQFNESGKMNRE